MLIQNVEVFITFQSCFLLIHLPACQSWINFCYVGRQVFVCVEFTKLLNAHVVKLDWADRESDFLLLTAVNFTFVFSVSWKKLVRVFGRNVSLCSRNHMLLNSITILICASSILIRYLDLNLLILVSFCRFIAIGKLSCLDHFRRPLWRWIRQLLLLFALFNFRFLGFRWSLGNFCMHRCSALFLLRYNRFLWFWQRSLFCSQVILDLLIFLKL